MRTRRAFALLGLGGVLAWACKDFVTGPGSALREARQVRLDSAQFVLADHTTLQLAARVLDQNDSPFVSLPAGVTLTWSSSAPAVATVDQTGLVSAVGPGQTNISATVTTVIGTLAASAAGTIVQPVARLVAINGAGQQDTIGGTLAESLAVKALDSLGAGVPGIAIQFAAHAGSLSAPGGITDAAGVAEVAWTLGNAPGADTVVVSSTALADSTVLFTAQTLHGAPVALAKVSGDAQTAIAGTPLAALLLVKVADRAGNPIFGNSITWAAVTGGGSVAPGVNATDSAGQAQAGWTLGGTVGGQTATATATGIATPAAFTATATSSGGGGGHLLTWVGGDGAGPTNWSDANNWSPAQAPGTGDTTVIPNAANSPVLTARAAVARVRVVGGTLTLAGHTLAVSDSFTVSFGGVVVMTSPADSLVVAGNFTTTGGDETGKLTAGVIDVGGDFVEAPGGSSSFATSGTLKVSLAGTSSQTVALAYAGGNLAHFQDLEIAGTSGLTLSGAIPVQGNVAVFAARPITGNDTLLVGGNLSMPVGSALTLPGLSVKGSLGIGGSYAVGLTNFAGTGQSIPVLPYQALAVTGPGATTAGAITATGGLVVSGTGTLALGGRTTLGGGVTVSGGSLTLGGHTLSANGALSVLFTGVMVMTNAQDSAITHGTATFGGGDETGDLTAGVLVVDGDFIQPGAFSAAAFAASGTHKTILTGLQNQAVSFYYGSGSISHFQNLELAGSVTITITGRTPVLGNLLIGADQVTSNDTVLVGGNLTMSSPSSGVILPGVVLGGALSVKGLYLVGVTNFAGTNQVIPTGTVAYDTIAVTGTGAVTQDTAAPVVATGALLIRNAGSLTLQWIMSVAKSVTVNNGTLTLNGHLLVAADSMTVNGAGTVVMTSAADSLLVEGVTTFGGADESGKLTAGTLIAMGDFVQPGAFSAFAFAPSGSFRTVFLGTVPQHVSFFYQGTSHFQDVDFSTAIGGVVLGSDVSATGILADTASFTPWTITGNGHTLTANAVNMNHVVLDDALFRVTGPIVAMNAVTFQNYGTGDTQLGVTGSGSYTLSGLTFSTTPTTGFYVSANGAGLNLTISSNLSPATAAALTQLLNGALVTWQ